MTSIEAHVWEQRFVLVHVRSLRVNSSFTILLLFINETMLHRIRIVLVTAFHVAEQVSVNNPIVGTPLVSLPAEVFTSIVSIANVACFYGWPISC